MSGIFLLSPAGFSGLTDAAEIPQSELELLERIEQQSRESSRMTNLMGRCRIGKTMLAREAGTRFSDTSIYLFVSRKFEESLGSEQA